jgi:hypothetical protein
MAGGGEIACLRRQAHTLGRGQVVRQRTLNPCTGGSNPSAPASVRSAFLEGVKVPAQQIVTPAAWIYAPDWLTPDQASYLTGHSVDHIKWMIQDGCVDTNDAGLIEKRSLHEFQESLALVLHWDE